MKKNKHSAFTLIELIVSIAVVAILAAGLFAVGNYIDTQMKIKRTQGTIELLVTAIEQYHDFYHEFPDPNNNDIKYTPSSCNDDIEKLYYRLTLVPEVRKIMEQLGSKSLKDSDGDKNLEVVDTWNKSLKYSYIKEQKWNFPVITSGGPDKDPNTAEDNISSKGL